MPLSIIIYVNIITKKPRKRNEFFHFYRFAQIVAAYLGSFTALIFFFNLKENIICVIINKT